MMAEQTDREITELFEAVSAPPRPGWRERAAAAFAERDNRRIGVSWRRLAVAAGAAVALALAGFIPVPAGRVHGAMDRAAAAAEQAATLHVVGHLWLPDGRRDVDSWMSEDGFSYGTGIDADGNPTVSVQEGDSYRSYYWNPERGAMEGREYFRRPAAPPLEAYRSGLFRASATIASMQSLRRSLGLPPLEVKITERRERSLWGGLVDVVEQEFTNEGNTSIGGVTYTDGDIVRLRAEIDAGTGRLMAMEQWKYEGAWERVARSDYQWDVEIPESIRHYRPPKGTTLTKDTWWFDRADRVVATAETDQHVVTLRAIDVGRRGDLVLSLTLGLKGEKPAPWANIPIMRVEARDDTGGTYHVTNRGDGYGSYTLWVPVLAPDRRGGNPRTVTLTVYPWPEGESANESVTFQNIPLPPRQDVDDPRLAADVVTQY